MNYEKELKDLKDLEEIKEAHFQKRWQRKQEMLAIEKQISKLNTQINLIVNRIKNSEEGEDLSILTETEKRLRLQRLDLKKKLEKL